MATADSGVSTNANPVGPFNSYTDMGLYDRCITRGIPNSMMPAGYGSNYEIHQGPGVATITTATAAPMTSLRRPVVTRPSRSAPR